MLAVVQARMSSRRLPGKVLRPLAGAPLLQRMLERVRRAASISGIVVATSVEPDDDPVAALAGDMGIAVHRGPLGDVLARFLGALEAAGRPEHFVRLTADCPLHDWEVLDAAVAAHLKADADLTFIQDGWTFPKGLDLEVCRTAALREAAAEAADPYEREHVLPFVHRREGRYRLERLRRDPPAPYLWAVDTAEDHAFVDAVFRALLPQDPAFRTEDVLRWQAKDPARVRLNPDWRPR